MPAVRRAFTLESLSHRFLLRSEDAELAGLAGELLGDFALPADGRGASPSVVYSIRRVDGHGYALDRGDEQIVASDDPEAVIACLLWQITADTIELADGYLLIHAGAVVAPGGDGMMILGESGSGKTTLVAALVQEGFGFLSDEAAAIAMETGLAHPWPRPLGFAPGSRSLARFAPLFPPGKESSSDGIYVVVGRIRAGAISGPCRIRHVIDHRYEAGATTRLAPLSRAEALVRAGSAAPRLRHEGNRGLAVLASVLTGARAYSLLSGDLERSVSALRELAG